MKRILISVAMAALAAPAFAQSVPARVAVIAVHRGLTTSTAGKAAHQRLKKLQEDGLCRTERFFCPARQGPGRFVPNCPLACLTFLLPRFVVCSSHPSTAGPGWPRATPFSEPS